MSLIFPWKKFLNNDFEELVNLCVDGDFRISVLHLFFWCCSWSCTLSDHPVCRQAHTFCVLVTIYSKVLLETMKYFDKKRFLSVIGKMWENVTTATSKIKPLVIKNTGFQYLAIVLTR